MFLVKCPTLIQETMKQCVADENLLYFICTYNNYITCVLVDTTLFHYFIKWLYREKYIFSCFEQSTFVIRTSI
jgi:hypothetical protein